MTTREKKAGADLTQADLKRAIRSGLEAEGYSKPAARKIANDVTDAAEMTIHAAQQGQYD